MDMDDQDMDETSWKGRIERAAKPDTKKKKKRQESPFFPFNLVLFFPTGCSPW